MIKYAKDGTAAVSSLEDVKIVEHSYYTVEGLDFKPSKFPNEYSAEDALREALVSYGYPNEAARQIAESRRQDVQA